MGKALVERENAKKPKAGLGARKQLEAAKVEEQRVLRMIQKGLYDEDKGYAEVLKLREKIQRLEADVRALGKVIEIAPQSRVDEICAAITKGGEPQGYHRRLVLDKIEHLTAVLDGNELEITGEVPMKLEGNAYADSDRNCTDGCGRLDEPTAAGCYRLPARRKSNPSRTARRPTAAIE
jgi:hypothetical protein